MKTILLILLLSTSASPSFSLFKGEEEAAFKKEKTGKIDSDVARLRTRACMRKRCLA